MTDSALNRRASTAVPAQGRSRALRLLGLCCLAIIAAIAFVRPATTSSISEWTPEQLLRHEAGHPEIAPSELWRDWGTNALPPLCVALAAKESSAAQKIRNLSSWLAFRLDLPELHRPTPEALRAAAAAALGSLGPTAAPAVETLAVALPHETDRITRLAEIKALEQIGRSASPALPILEQLRHGDDEEQIRFAREAIEAIRN